MPTMKLKSPVSVTLNITSKCNHNCPYCYNDWRQSDLQQTMTKEHIDKFVEIMAENEVFQVNISGGEPSCAKKELLYAVKQLRQKDIDVSLNSNLSTEVNSAFLDTLVTAGVKGIITSLPNQDRDKCNQTIGIDAFDAIVENIKYAISVGITVKANTIITENLYDLYETAVFVKDLGINQINCAYPAPPDYEDIDLETYRVTAEKIVALADVLLKIKEGLGLRVGCVVPFPLCVLNDIQKYLPLLDSACKAGVNYMRVNWDGSAHACTSEVENYGNIFESPFSKIWDNMQVWRNRENLNINCQKCGLIEYCGGECRQFSKRFPDNKYVEKVKLSNWKDLDLRLIEIDKSKTYHINPNVRVREEEFGATIHVLYINNAHIDITGYQAYKVMCELGEFRYEDLLAHMEESESLNYLLSIFIEKEILQTIG